MEKQVPPILQARDLHIGYRSGRQPVTTVAGPLQLEVHPGQLICLLGPNGSGKSTLIRTLAGLQPMLAGQVEIAGEDISRLKPAAIAQKLSMVLTDKIRTGNLDAYTLVALGRYPYTGWLGTLSAADIKIIQWAITATETEALMHRKMDQLSDGENQKVMLARALAQDTPLVILDEPTAHLDLPNRVQLLRLLHRLARQTNKGILLSTHELDLALQAGDQVWLLNQDGHFTTGTPEDLVLNGSFEKAFARAGFHFDKATGSFNLHQAHGPQVNLTGDGASFFWTSRALQRDGYALASGNAEARCTVQVIEAKNGCRWVCEKHGNYSEHSTIAAMLSWLRTATGTTEKAAVFTHKEA